MDLNSKIQKNANGFFDSVEKDYVVNDNFNFAKVNFVTDKFDNIAPMVLKDSKVYIPSIIEVEEEKAEVDANQK